MDSTQALRPVRGKVPVPPFEALTQDRQVLKLIMLDELKFASNFMAWFVHEDNEFLRSEGWGELWKVVLSFPSDPRWLTRAGPPPDMMWRWLAEVAARASEEGDVRLPSQTLGCVLYWDLLDSAPYDSSYRRMDGSPTLRPPVAAPKIKATLGAIALRCLLLLPAGEGMLYRQGAVWTASDLALTAAEVVHRLGAEYGLLSRELAALARDTLDRHGGHAEWRSASSRHRGSLLPQPFGPLPDGFWWLPG